MIYVTKKFDDLTFVDDYMFALANEKNPNIPIGEIELLTKVKVDALEIVKSQYSIDNYLEAKSIRYDVYAKDDKSNKHYDIEMQTTSDPALIKRARYYASTMDGEALAKGQTYDKLADTFVIFICTYNPFPSQNSAIYIERPSLLKKVNETEVDITKETQYKNGCVKIYLNTSVDLNTVKNKDLRAFIEFINTGIATNDFTKEIEKTVLEQKQNSLERMRYMTFQQELQNSQKEWYTHGKKDGVEEGTKQTKRDAVIKFYSNGLSISAIADGLSLTVEQVEEIISSNSDDYQENTKS